MKQEEMKYIIESVKGLGQNGMKDFGNELGKALSETETSDSEILVSTLVDNIPSETKKKMVTKIFEEAPEQTQQELATALGFPPPTVKTRDKLWTTVVWSFSIVMVGAFLFIAMGAFQEKPQNPIASGDILLSIFTASVGFFAGLFAPSPGKEG